MGLSAFLVNSPTAFIALYTVCCSYTLIRCWDIVNIKSAVIILACAKCIVFLLYSNTALLGHYVTYILWLLFDGAMLFVVMFRVVIMRAIYPSKPQNNFVITRADMLLVSFYILHLVINTLALLEHILRNISDLGAPQDANWVLFLHNYARLMDVIHLPLTHILSILELLGVWLTIKNYRESSRVLGA